MFLEIKNTTVGILCKNNIVQLPGNYFSFPQGALIKYNRVIKGGGALGRNSFFLNCWRI